MPVVAASDLRADVAPRTGQTTGARSVRGPRGPATRWARSPRVAMRALTWNPAAKRCRKPLRLDRPFLVGRNLILPRSELACQVEANNRQDSIRLTLASD